MRHDHAQFTLDYMRMEIRSVGVDRGGPSEATVRDALRYLDGNYRDQEHDVCRAAFLLCMSYARQGA